MKQMHPNLSTRQVMKHLTRSWNCMTSAQRQRYIDMSKKDRMRFEAQRERHKHCITSGQPCNCKVNEAQEQSVIRSMVGPGAPILTITKLSETSVDPSMDNERLIVVDAPTLSKSGRPRGRPIGSIREGHLNCAQMNSSGHDGSMRSANHAKAFSEMQGLAGTRQTEPALKFKSTGEELNLK